MAGFFINRPIFAWVVAILIMMFGAGALARLPVAQYPSIAPPEVTITARYPGASAKTLEQTVTQVIEQRMKGLDHLLYMYSSSDSAGSASISFAFEAGTDINIAQVQVQNKLQLAMPLLPQEVQRQGVMVAKSTRNYLMIMSFLTEDGSMTNTDIADYIAANILDTIGLLDGVGEVSIFGAQYAMRIWLDPYKFEQYKLNPSDVIAAIQAQNAQIAGGQVGAAPAVKGQEINITVNASSRLETPAQFEQIFLRNNPDGSVLRLKDVARIELDGEGFNAFSRYNGQPSAGLAIKLASGANALNTADIVKKEMQKLSTFFPTGLKVVYAYDTTPFVKLSIESVFYTLGEAIILVFLVMWLFLQNFRATLIPTIAVPVVLLGTFGVLAAFGFSINTLTMFGLVLAIGLLVDDAIVVVENVERIMRDEHLPPKEATEKSMGQITSALVGVALVISAVFVPMAFIGGATGVIFRQFSVTIVSAMLLSLLVALVLTPALCATMLKPHIERERKGFFGFFNTWFHYITLRYQRAVRVMVGKPVRYLLIFALGLALMAVVFMRIPTSFLPEEDQGMLLISVQLPSGATFERTQDVLSLVTKYFLETEEKAVASVMTVAGMSHGGGGQNTGMAFVRLKPWHERKDKNLKVPALVARAFDALQKIPQAQIFAFAPPAILELGAASGFDYELIDRGNNGHEAMMAARSQLLSMARADQRLTNVRPNGLDDVAQYELDMDLAKAGALGLTKGDINNAIASYWGSTYVNDFTHGRRTRKVYIQADAPFRMQPRDFERYHVRNNQGEMVPFSAFLTVKAVQGSPRLERYNGVPSMEIMGQAAEGRSSGEAMKIMEELTAKLPPGFDFAWTGMSYQEKLAGKQAFLLYALSAMVVFLCLAALYESWSIPFSVILVVPTGIIGAVCGAWALGKHNDIYFQIGLLTIMGLSAKNSILIVAFAKDLYLQGMDIIKATGLAVKMRLRPIIMTSMAFILGVLPLALSTGAGSGGQNAIGATVVFGMLVATSLGLFFTPLFFVLITNIFGRVRLPKAALAVCLVLLSGCTMAPTYKRPDAPIPNNYAAQSADNDKIATLPAPAQFFKDEPMARLIGLALENNRDLRLAMLNIEKTRAQYRIQRADLLPTINATGSLNWQHLPADIAGGGVEKTTRQYTASLGFSAFELDLFGRIRSLKDQALENFYAVQEEARAAKLSLTAEVAAVYLQLVADRQQYDLTQATLENRKKNHDIIYRKFKAGIASDLELSQAESVLNEAQANLAVSAAMIGQDENHLMLLIAAPLPKDLPGVRRLADVKAFEDVSSGAPSLLLARRPDIRAAEHMLKGAGANIGAARANFFPIISLTGNFGTMSLDMRNLFEGPSQSWSFFPQIVLPLFDTGRNIARLEVAKAERAMAVARYEKAIQTGFREVTDALIQRDNMAARLMAQESLVASTTRSMDHATARYEAGIDAYINVLDAQRSLFSAQSTMIAVHLLRETNALTLYKALGGGW